MPTKFAVKYFYALILFSLLMTAGMLPFVAFSLFSSDGLLYLMSQVAIGVYWGLVLGAAPSWARWPLSGVYLIGTILNVEHILINNAHTSMSFVGFAFHRSFFLSMFGPSLLRTALFIITAFFVSLWVAQFIKVKIGRSVTLVGVGLLFLLDLAMPRNIALPRWQQENFLIAQLRNSFGGKARGTIAESEQPIRYKKELDGKLRKGVKTIESPNVVVLVLEGFSQFFVELGLAPKIAEIQKKSFVLNNFITNQQQTNRGLYSLFCADYPNLLVKEAKSDILAAGIIDKDCLPNFLKKFNYQSYFLQSAPLSFMRKDIFAKKAGYDFAVGAESFAPDKIISPWGISDLSLIEAMLKILIERARTKLNDKRPKFISALTVGTHHPYVTPVSQGSLVDAIKYTDSLVGAVYQKLQETGLLENTVLVLTSDEAKPLSPRQPLTFSNWGLLSVTGAGIEHQIVETPYSQVDLSLSIADLIGKGENADFIGRSFFREYTTDYPIFFGNVYSERVFLAKNLKEYLICDHSLDCMEMSAESSFLQEAGKVKKRFSKQAGQIANFILHNDKSFKDVDILFSEEDLKLEGQERYHLLTEFKIGADTSKNLEVLLLGSKQGVLGHKATVLKTFYECGKSETMKFTKDQVILMGEDSKLKFEIPTPMWKKLLCVGLIIETETDKKLPISKIVLRNRKDLDGDKL